MYLTDSKATTVMPASFVVSTVNSMFTVPLAAEGLNVLVAVMPKDLPVALLYSVPVTVYSLFGIRFE